MASSSAPASPDKFAADRRKSRASFIEKFGIDSSPDAADDEAVFGMLGRGASASDDKDEYTSVINEGSDEAKDDDDKLGDDYDFDDHHIAEALRQGVDQATLLRAFEEAYADSFKRKLAQERAPKPTTPPLSKLNPYATPFTPTRSDDGAQSDDSASTCESDTIAGRIKQAMASAKARRRLSAANRAASGVGWVRDAREAAVLRSRMDGAAPAEKITCAQYKAEIRHRKSICRAADILVCAGYDESADETVINSLNRVAQAMEHARRNHRRSVAHAVGRLREPDEFVEPSSPAPNSDQAEASDGDWASAGGESGERSWDINGLSSTHSKINEYVLSAYHKHWYAAAAVAASAQQLQQERENQQHQPWQQQQWQQYQQQWQQHMQGAPQQPQWESNGSIWSPPLPLPNPSRPSYVFDQRGVWTPMSHSFGQYIPPPAPPSTIASSQFQ